MLTRKAGHHVGLPTQIFRLGKAFERAGQAERALACWHVLIRQYPSTPEAALARQPQQCN